MSSLRLLNVYNNDLRALPAEIGKIVNDLEEFDASRNPLSDFPKKWCKTWTTVDQYVMHRVQRCMIAAKHVATS